MQRAVSHCVSITFLISHKTPARETPNCSSTSDRARTTQVYSRMAVPATKAYGREESTRRLRTHRKSRRGCGNCKLRKVKVLLHEVALKIQSTKRSPAVR
jgi:hypothetical protein